MLWMHAVASRRCRQQLKMGPTTWEKLKKGRAASAVRSRPARRVEAHATASTQHRDQGRQDSRLPLRSESSLRLYPDRVGAGASVIETGGHLKAEEQNIPIQRRCRRAPNAALPAPGREYLIICKRMRTIASDVSSKECEQAVTGSSNSFHRLES